VNILFVISSLKHGGAEKQTVTDANFFSDKHNVTFVTFENGELGELINEKVNLIVLEKRGYLSTSRKLRNIIEGNKIDIINASLFASMIISCLASGKMNVPVIWFFHSHEYDMILKSRIALKYFSRYRCLKKILFVSNELKNHMLLKGYKFQVEKQDVLYNTFTVSTGLRKNKIFNERITIGYIGRLVKLKRVEYLIDLAVYLKNNNINNFIIDIIGEGIFRERLYEYAIKSEVSSFVNFLGFQADVSRYYGSFDIFVLPSREECLSISLIDACAVNLPCVAFDIGGNDEIILNDKSGYLVKTKEEMFDKVKLLITDKEKRNIMGSEAGKYCVNKFSMEKRMEYLENNFNNITKKYAE
jgi:L-malate glycosyltransferase